MYVRINGARSEDLPFAGYYFGTGAHFNIHVRLDVGITRFTNTANASVFNRNVGFNDSPVIQNKCVGNYRIRCVVTTGLTLTHAITNNFTATELYFFSVGGVVFFYFYPKFCITQTHHVAHSRAKHIGIGTTINFTHYKSPITSALKP